MGQQLAGLFFEVSPNVAFDEFAVGNPCGFAALVPFGGRLPISLLAVSNRQHVANARETLIFQLRRFAE